MNCIATSFFDLYKVGPGPSSSHTIGPMRAANAFLSELEACREQWNEKRASRLEVHFYGSLALTGKGHGSDRAVLVGLLGEKPESCDTEKLNHLFDINGATYPVETPAGTVDIGAKSVVFHNGTHPYEHPNTLIFKLLGEDGTPLIESVYFSVGGGFIRKRGEEPLRDDVSVPHRYHSMDTFQKMLYKSNIRAIDALIRNELALGRVADEEELRRELRRMIQVMLDAVERGLHAEGLLPGPLGVRRRAASVFNAAVCAEAEDRTILLLDAFALAASEENAAGNLIVTAPTSGSAGVLPGIIYYLTHYRKVSMTAIENGLMFGSLIGCIARHNGSISGAEVGCQGEVGVASAMGAALLASVRGDNILGIEVAAEIALEHHLGLSCDPVAGYVQVPCIERNAVGTVTAYNAYLLAGTLEGNSGKVTFDEALSAMYQTGCKMSSEFKETSLGGLAVCSCCM